MAILRVSPEEAKKLIDDQGYAYVDVRSEPEYSAGHPTGSLNVPLLKSAPGGMVQNADFVVVMQALFPKDAKLVLGCRAGSRSLRAAELLLAVGFTEVVDQRAGYDGARNAFGGVVEPGWTQVGLPTATASAGNSYAELRVKVGK